MALVASGSPSRRLVKVVPTFRGNDRADNPTVVWVHHPSQQEKETLMIEAAKGVTDEPALVVRMFVDRVENYSDADGGPIETAAQLELHGDKEVRIEVYQEVCKLLRFTDDEQKKSEGSSGSPHPATPLSNGTAENASPGVSPKSATASEPETTQTSSTSLKA